jgi:hypothetical protein
MFPRHFGPKNTQTSRGCAHRLDKIQSSLGRGTHAFCFVFALLCFIFTPARGAQSKNDSMHADGRAGEGVKNEFVAAALCSPTRVASKFDNANGRVGWRVAHISYKTHTCLSVSAPSRAPLKVDHSMRKLGKLEFIKKKNIFHNISKLLKIGQWQYFDILKGWETVWGNE